jgi:putative peptidoglycan lipid II flippase
MEKLMSIANVATALLDRWREFGTGSTNRRIFNAALIVGGLTFGVKLLAMVKDAIVAAFFGTNDAVDAFFIAFVLPTYVIQVVAGSLNAALVPIYVEIKQKEGHAGAQRLFSGVVSLSIGLFILVTILLALAGPQFLRMLGPGFGPEKLALTEGLFYMLLPAIVLTGLSTLWRAVINAEESFALATASSVAVPLAQVVLLITAGAAWGIYAMCAGTVVGFFLELLFLAHLLRTKQISIRPRWFGFEPALRRVIGQYVPVIAGAALISCEMPVDQSMATILGAGSVAALNYGIKLVAVITSVGTYALGTAVLPYFSRMVAMADWQGIRNSLRVYSRAILALTIPLTVLVCLLSNVLVRLIYQRGSFSETDALMVSNVQAMYVLQLPFVTLGILFVRLISSLQANYILVWNTLISFFLNVSLDYILMNVIGLPGIALATSLLRLASCLFLCVMLFRTLNRAEAGEIQYARSS